MDELQQELFKLQDLKYRNFHSKLMPGTKGGALGRPGHFRLTAEGPIGRKRAGLATEGSRFWTTHLSSCRWPRQQGTTVHETNKLCSSRGNLTGLPRALPLGELARKRLRGQGCCPNSSQGERLSIKPKTSATLLRFPKSVLQMFFV